MQLGQMQCLIVEDMDALRKIMAEQLRQLGFGQVLQADCGRQALDVLQRHQIELLLLDWSMPDGDGQELLENLRQQEKWRELPIILVTANAHRGLVDAALKYGVSDIIAKPFNSKTLQARVLQALTRRHKRAKSVPTLPIASNAAVTPMSEPSSAMNVVLVVDDMPDNLAFMAGLLNDEYKVLFAKDGKAALKICQSTTPPDAVLLDVMMPEMDGHQVLQALRSEPKSAQIPVIFVSALGEVEHHLQGLRGGAIDYLNKPVQPEILKLKLANVLAQMQRQRTLQQECDEMQRLARLKDSADGIMSHDLKNPLVTISALAQKLAQDKSCPKDWLPKINLVDELALQSINTVNLTSDILRIEAGQYALDAEWFSVHEMLKQLLQAAQVNFHSKQLVAYLLPDEDPNSQFDVIGDPKLCHPMLFNLIKNAFEAARAKTKVAISLMRQEGEVLIAIENTGVVPVDIREQFWEKYVTQGKSEGLGIGTYAARLFARAQKGEANLVVDDTKLLTRVEIRLPAAIDAIVAEE
ncbi:response regulator receiver sensor signal transduction histidine kinase [Shewanella sp. MR-4]|uniref:ATP-binding response regulator n=1 Tax=Shewanella sp. (strain MR-4) TaxID=60480 RepID=UPI00005E5E4A|nr:response regulator [Shewanella sp. MR-4]ABI37563.1 response regulator receiver sensor signal transduction histidine kinase [Shewanella sp. MR-4]